MNIIMLFVYNKKQNTEKNIENTIWRQEIKHMAISKYIFLLNIYIKKT